MGEAATAWRAYCERHPLSEHTWEAMKALLQDCVAPPQRRSAGAFGQLRNAKQGHDQLVTSFVVYITGLARETDVSDTTKRMFLLTGLHPEVRSMMPRSITYEAFDAMVDAVIRAENDLQFEAKCVRTWSQKDKATDKSAAKHDHQQLQRHHSPAGRDARGADRLRDGHGGFRKFRGRGHGRGHGRGRGNSTPRGDHAGSSSGAASRGRGEKL
jgi:hypothetical protein